MNTTYTNYKVRYDQAVIVIAKQQAQIADLERMLAEKERIIQDLAGRLQETMNALADWRWRKRMDNISFKRVSTPQKKILTAIRDTYVEAPHAQGEIQIHIKALASQAEMSESSVRGHLRELEKQGWIAKRYEGNGAHGDEYRDKLFIMPNPGLLDDPAKTAKALIPIERGENRGGKREKKTETSDACCWNCSSPHVRGHRYEELLCDDCERLARVWQYYPVGIKEPEIWISDDKYPERVGIAL